MMRIWTFVAAYVRSRRSARWRSREALERWQERRVRRHLRFVRRRSAFYREWWGDRPLEDWREYPTIDKSVMMANFDRLNTAGIAAAAALAAADDAERTRDFTSPLGSVTVGLSSGTSGNRGLFLVGESERAAWAGTVLGKLLPGTVLSRWRIAFFLRAGSRLYAAVGSRRLKFEFFDLLEPMSGHIDRLGQYRPDIVVAPPSALRMLADAVRSGRLTHRPTRLVSVAEVLDPLDRTYVEQAFGQTLHEAYQCTEGFLGCTCAHGTMHLNEDIVCIQKEYVSGKPRTFVPIVTDFSRRTQPIVRYRLNDLLVERESPCPCGSSFVAIERIEGRCDDMLSAPVLFAGEEDIRIFPDFVSRAVIGASPLIAQYRVIQTEADVWRVELDVPGEQMESCAALVTSAIAALCETLRCRMPQLQFAPYAFVPGDRKLRRVARSVGR